jgi:lysophospholipase L1-like esterase
VIRRADPWALALALACLLVILAEAIPRLVELPNQLARRRSIDTGLYVLDDAAGYVMHPHYSGRWSTAEYDQPFQTNARGLRGPELGPKAAGEFRIVVIGDSMVFGGQVAEDQRFTERLEAILKSRGSTQVRVVNVGVPGWTTFNEAGYLEANMSWLQPDLVVLAVYLGNDIEENVMVTMGAYDDNARLGVRYGQRTREVVRNSVEWFPHNFAVGAVEYAQPHIQASDWRTSEPLPKPPVNMPSSSARTGPVRVSSSDYVPSGLPDASRTWLKQNSRLYASASNAWFFVRHGHNRPAALSLDQWLAFTLRDEPRQYWMQVGYPLTEQYLAQARTATIAAGAGFIALVIPHDAQIDDAKGAAELRRFHLSAAEVDLDRPRREIVDRAARRGIETIDLLPVLRARADRAALTYMHDLHFTPLGHAVVAEILAAELTSARASHPAMQVPRRDLPDDEGRRTLPMGGLQEHERTPARQQ